VPKRPHCRVLISGESVLSITVVTYIVEYVADQNCSQAERTSINVKTNSAYPSPKVVSSASKFHENGYKRSDVPAAALSANAASLKRPSHWQRSPVPSSSANKRQTQQSPLTKSADRNHSSLKFAHLRPSFGKTNRGSVSRTKISECALNAASSTDINEDQSRDVPDAESLADISFQQSWLKPLQAAGARGDSLRIEEFEADAHQHEDIGAVTEHHKPMGASRGVPKHSSLGSAPAGSLRSLLHKICRTEDNSESKLYASYVSPSGTTNPKPSDPLHPRNAAVVTVEFSVEMVLDIRDPFLLVLVSLTSVTHKSFSNCSKEGQAGLMQVHESHGNEEGARGVATASVVIHPFEGASAARAGERVLGYFRTDIAAADKKSLAEIGKKYIVLDPLFVRASESLKQRPRTRIDNLVDPIEVCMICTNLRVLC
jgi:hypothetical protein